MLNNNSKVKIKKELELIRLKKNVEDITHEEFINFTTKDFKSYSDDELEYLFDKYIYSKTREEDSVSIRDLLLRFGYDTDGFDVGVLDLKFSCKFNDSFIRRNKIVFVGDDGGFELVLDKDSRERCVVVRMMGGEWVYSALGGLMCMS